MLRHLAQQRGPQETLDTLERLEILGGGQQRRLTCILIILLGLPRILLLYSSLCTTYEDQDD